MKKRKVFAETLNILLEHYSLTNIHTVIQFVFETNDEQLIRKFFRTSLEGRIMLDMLPFIKRQQDECVAELIFRNIWDKLRDELNVEITHRDLTLTCDLSIKYWHIPCFQEVCKYVIRSVSDEDLKYLAQIKMHQGMTNYLIQILSNEQILSAITHDPIFIDMSPDTYKYFVERLVQLKPEIFDDMKFDVSSLNADVWYKAVMLDVPRSKYGKEFVMRNYSNVNVIEAAIQYPDISEKLFVIVYKLALSSYNEELINILKSSEYFEEYNSKLPEDY